MSSEANNGTTQTTEEPSTGSFIERALDWVEQGWRPGGTAVAVVLALLLMWHVVNGQNGLTSWHQKRSEDKQLKQEIKQLEQENEQLRSQVDHLRSDPDAIEREARERLHYAKPNEVIVALPAQTQQAPATTSK